MAVRRGSRKYGVGSKGRWRSLDEQGQVLVWVLVLLPLLLLMAALLIEGGLMYRTYRLAQMAADAAAHAAAQELDVALYMRTGRVALTPNAATVARNIATTNTRGQVTCGVPQVWANRVELICQADLHPVVLIGGPTVHVSVRGRARPAWGATGEYE
jgi:hypothetical protein